MEPYGTALFAAIFVSIALSVASERVSRIVDRVLPAVDRFASRPVAPILCCGLLSFVGSAAVATFVMWPEPRVHDEFSYLLAADTFAHGRLTNPTHPLWQHFESFHIFHEPTYASKYPPAQGLMLALGIVLGGHPVVGVWLSGALMCGAICWALRGYASARWALLGAIAATLQVGIATLWTQTYWGGAVAALGGALVTGAAVRLAREPRVRDALIGGVGLVVLANSRPFEGAITSIPAAFYVAFSSGLELSRWRRAVAPALAVLALGVAMIAYYDQAVTGHWWLPPYIHHEQTYASRPTLALQGMRSDIKYRNPEMRLYYTGSADDAAEPRPGANAETALTLDSAEKLRRQFVGRALLVPLVVGVLLATRRREVAMLDATLVFGVAVLTFLHYFQAHYLAPITAAVFALVAAGLERLDAWRPAGRRLGTGLCAAALVASVGALVGDIERVPSLHTGFGYDDTAEKRPRAIAELLASPGRDVVVVQYGPAHDVNNEWVYNDADIDSSEIVWARDMGSERNRELLDYFHDRRAWLYRRGFGADEDGLRPYPSGAH